MIIETKVLDVSGVLVFQGDTTINSAGLFKVAKSREDMVRSKGEEWTKGAIPFWGGELVKIIQAGEIGAAVEEAAIKAAMATWLYEKNFCGTAADVFAASNLEYVMLDNKAVLYTRHAV